MFKWKGGSLIPPFYCVQNQGESGLLPQFLPRNPSGVEVGEARLDRGVHDRQSDAMRMVRAALPTEDPRES